MCQQLSEAEVKKFNPTAVKAQSDHKISPQGNNIISLIIKKG